MVLLEVRRTRGAALVLLLAVGLTDIASSQSASTTEEQRRVLTEQIEQALVQGGSYAKELIDPLRSLAEIYQQSGNHDLAAAVTEQAMQVIRANYGLRSLDQAPLIRERIRIEEERGNAPEAWSLEHSLLTLARANLGDVRSADIFAEIGEKRMDLLRRFESGERPPQLQLGCYYSYYEGRPLPLSEESNKSGCTSGSQGTAARAMLADAQRNKIAAIGVLFRAGQFSSPELRGLELDLVRSTYAYGGRYETGRESLRRLMTYAAANGEPMINRANALLQLADWDLLYEHRAQALDTYEATYETLKRNGVEPASIDELLSPAIPIVLPAFEPNPLATPPSAEHIDVSFEITRFGVGGHAKVLAKTANVSREAERRLIRLIEQQRFRPRVADGAFPRSVVVQVRYYASE